MPVAAVAAGRLQWLRAGACGSRSLLNWPPVWHQWRRPTGLNYVRGHRWHATATHFADTPVHKVRKSAIVA